MRFCFFFLLWNVLSPFSTLQSISIWFFGSALIIFIRNYFSLLVYYYIAVLVLYFLGWPIKTLVSIFYVWVPCHCNRLKISNKNAANEWLFCLPSILVLTENLWKYCHHHKLTKKAASLVQRNFFLSYWRVSYQTYAPSPLNTSVYISNDEKCSLHNHQNRQWYISSKWPSKSTVIHFLAPPDIQPPVKLSHLS